METFDSVACYFVTVLGFETTVKEWDRSVQLLAMELSKVISLNTDNVEGNEYSSSLQRRSKGSVIL